MTARIALITGGNRGLGRATALAVAENGIDVIITYRSHADEAAAVVDEVRALGRTAVALQLDTSRIVEFGPFSTQLREVLAATWQRDTFDYLVNNAGSAALTPLGQTDEAAFDQMVDVHFKGVYFLTQELEPLLADNGRVILTSTGLARFVGIGPYSIYASVKGAVEVLTRYLAKQLGARGITVNAVAPGPVATDFGGGRVRDDAEMRTAMGSQTALGRVGEAEDIGPVTAALLGDGMSWVTGQRIEASGGTLL
ncbi:SDR family NAD(P)-dependent oxidoreductase [Leifsonia poae]|uniref:Short-chain dehydrogenase n=1 Tax=Leifsonia poae TaxID=110933 RepID=A0A9W6LZB2_9MICO|nr:SDR family oxidoreductase [Leifsonia poae]GLJ75434.1 short-chain dehydrogenase [Leifsonia poae]